ncbi:MAG: MurR/RpiR family transcriptional regulator [Anaerolineaceae bacterium]|nr:MurR/RpiR family transcriptional regulator [Anaerolineaceae bacterium]
MSENTSENVFELISNNYYELTASEKKIADYIIADPEQVQQSGISDLAEACGTAMATVSRFSRKLGFDGFNAMRIAIAQAVSTKSGSAELLTGKITMEDSFEDECKKIQTADLAVITQTYELIDQEIYETAIRMLLNAKKVVCMGQGGSVIIAMEAAHLFSTVSGKFSCVQDNHMQVITISNMDENDVLIYFSYSGSVRDMMENFALARARGVKTILLTRFPKSPGAEMADVVLQCGSSESPLQLGSIPARISQLFMLDVLFSEYCRRDYDAARESRRRIATAISEKHVE